MGPFILSLCDRSGNWSQPYVDNGYEVMTVDLARDGQDIRLLKYLGRPVHGILAAPPCTHFSGAGAWMWEKKGESALLEGLALVDACLRMVAVYKPVFWALENPKGRLKDYLGPPAWRFDPCEFGDNYTKRTCLWGHFTPPRPLFAPQARKAVRPELHPGKPGSRDRTTYLGSKGREQRSVTPMGFAQAFFEANP
jgi:hypothetical protein